MCMKGSYLLILLYNRYIIGALKKNKHRQKYKFVNLSFKASTKTYNFVSLDLCCRQTCTVELWWPVTPLMTPPSTSNRATTASPRRTVYFATWPWCTPRTTL